MIIALAVGILAGWMFPEFSRNLKILSNIFLRMIKSIIAPILFGTLVVGIAGNASTLKSVGRLALKSLVYFQLVTTLALFIGWGAVNLTRPGDGVSLKAESTNIVPFAQQQKLSWQGMIEHIVPKSFIEAVANNDVLPIVFFSILFAIAVTQAPQRHRETMIRFCESLSEVMFKFTGIVMKFAPLGIGAAMASTVGESGIGVLLNLGKLVLTVYGALAVLLAAVFLPVMLYFRIPPQLFWRAAKEPSLIAFTTTSSDAALPDALKHMMKFGVPGRIVSFVLPTGYSFNLAGSTLYLAVASIFVAQAAGAHLSAGQQFLIMLSLMLTTKGIAAVPRASLIILSGTLLSFGLPLEGVAVILGVDAVMDMARTSVNMLGNCLASAVIARSEGELNIPGDSAASQNLNGM